MNVNARKYWDEFWQGTKQPESMDAWQFGYKPDELAKLVVDGIKTATTSGYIFYELEKASLPMIDHYSIILNSQDNPVAIIRIVDVQIIPMNEVSVEHALAEGEGDYQSWKEGHEVFFKNELLEIGREFCEDMLVVCEKFELVDVKG